MRFFLILALLSFLFQRPMALGNAFTLYGFIFLFFVSFIVYGFSIKKDLSAVNTTIFISFLVIILPLFLFRILNGGSVGESILCLSSIVTTFFSFFIPIDNWFIGDMSIERNDFHYNFYYPYTISQMKYYILPTMSVLRCNHFFGEPGIAPCFISAALIMTIDNKYARFRNLKIVVYVLGILITFSTTGPAVLFAGLSVYYLFNGKFSVSKIIVFFLISIGGFLLFLYMPGFGLIDKSESTAYGSSVDARYGNFQNWDFIIYIIATVILYFLILPLKKNKRGGLETPTNK